MFSPSRRLFLGSSLAALGAGRLLGADKPAAPVKARDDFPFQPSTLFLTWQRDPTTTMTVQWVGTRGETTDTAVHYSPECYDEWKEQPTDAKPYPM
ncbi:MAG TPA: metallophosphoesterase, partial [Gemmataceae bacterium]|nr:metallophosphoesterase [Gemmataceae bacterium]